MTSARYPVFVRRDLDGFFGLAVDNLVQLLLIVSLCGLFCGMTGDNASYITELILPGAAVSLVIGNLFYAWQAHRLARREGRSDVTALPYGINTPSLLVYVFFVMKPAYERSGDPSYAWKLGLIACLGSGVIEFLGSFVAERLRRNTPRAALLGTLAGIAITFISMTFALQIWQRPLVAMVPMAIVLLVYFTNVKFPLSLPGGMVAVLIATALAWILSLVEANFGYAPVSHVNMQWSAVQAAWNEGAWHGPQWVGPIIWETLHVHGSDILPLVSVIIPMGFVQCDRQSAEHRVGRGGR
jgi:adenine/guanine/hypoxanthine permease